MPRRRDGAPDPGSVHALVEELVAGAEPALPPHDPERALELVQGGLAGDEVEEVRTRALEALSYIARMDHLEAIGAIVTTPREAAERGRMERAADAERWRRVLTELG